VNESLYLDSVTSTDGLMLAAKDTGFHCQAKRCLTELAAWMLLE